MGLDGRVYRNKGSLTLDVEAMGAKKNSAIGEYYFDDPVVEHMFPRGFFVAAEKRFGNISAIDQLRLEVAIALGNAETLLHAKCLYSGSHSGDVIECRYLDALEDEIFTALSRTEGKRSELLHDFLNSMAELIAVAKKENNPIVF